MPNVKPISPEFLITGACYVGRHKKSGLYVFRYLGYGDWSAGIFVSKYPNTVPTTYTYQFNKNNVLAYLVLGDGESPEDICQKCFGMSLGELNEATSSLPSKEKVKYKVVNSLKPLYRVV